MTNEWSEYQRSLDRFDDEARNAMLASLGGEQQDGGSLPRIVMSEDDRAMAPRESASRIEFEPSSRFNEQARPSPEAETLRQDFDSNGQPIQGGSEQAQVMRELLEAVRSLPAEIVDQLRSSG